LIKTHTNTNLYDLLFKGQNGNPFLNILKHFYIYHINQITH